MASTVEVNPSPAASMAAFIVAISVWRCGAAELNLRIAGLNPLFKSTLLNSNVTARSTVADGKRFTIGDDPGVDSNPLRTNQDLIGIDLTERDLARSPDW